jgi:hypothetical protein
MRLLKYFSTLFFSAIVTILFVSCHKEYVSEGSISDPGNISTKVITWLNSQEGQPTDENSSNSTNVQSYWTHTGPESQVKKMNTAQISNIELLKKNLDFTKAHMEWRDKDLNYLIIPIKDDVLLQKGLDKKSSLNLLLVVDKQEDIKFGRIVYFTPSDGKKHERISTNTFSNLFYHKPNNENGMFRYMSITGRWLYQIEYKDGKEYSFGIIRPKADTAKQKRLALCIDWSIVTTYHFANGSSYTTTEYVGTTCDCGDGSYMSLCPGGQGGGGEDVHVSGVIEEDDNEEVSVSDSGAIEEDGNGEPDGSNSLGLSWPDIIFQYNSNIFLDEDTRLVEGCYQYDAAVKPIVSNLYWSNGRVSTRTLTVPTTTYKTFSITNGGHNLTMLWECYSYKTFSYSWKAGPATTVQYGYGTVTKVYY